MSSAAQRRGVKCGHSYKRKKKGEPIWDFPLFFPTWFAQPVVKSWVDKRKKKFQNYYLLACVCPTQ